jgi:hypothetical protein
LTPHLTLELSELEMHRMSSGTSFFSPAAIWLSGRRCLICNWGVNSKVTGRLFSYQERARIELEPAAFLNTRDRSGPVHRKRSSDKGKRVSCCITGVLLVMADFFPLEGLFRQIRDGLSRRRDRACAELEAASSPSAHFQWKRRSSRRNWPGAPWLY